MAIGLGTFDFLPQSDEGAPQKELAQHLGGIYHASHVGEGCDSRQQVCA